MGFPDYKSDLLDEDFDANYILDKYYHSGTSAVFHGAAPDVEPKLKGRIAEQLYHTFKFRIHPFQLVISGSAHLGFSPVPSKLGKPFNAEESDIDIAVVSDELFDAWWAELQSGGLDPSIRADVSRNLFWGFLNPAVVRDYSDYGRKWWDLFGALATDRAEGVRGRLYRTYWSMQSYHKLAIHQARQKLMNEEAANVDDTA